ncbi:MAG: hypothetical protein ACRERY_02165 [Pseudomonas sp.]
MAKWIITFNKDGNTSKLETESAKKPSMERAIQLVREVAEQKYEPQDPGEPGETQAEPALVLFERYGITITGIAKVG